MFGHELSFSRFAISKRALYKIADMLDTRQFRKYALDDYSD